MNIELLKENHIYHHEVERQTLGAIANGTIWSLSPELYSLWLFQSCTFAAYHQLIENDWIKVKQCFYLGGRCVLFGMRKFTKLYDRSMLTYHQLGTILLSDSPALIRAAGTASSEWHDAPGMYDLYFLPKFWQACIRDDQKDMEFHFERLSQLMAKSKQRAKWEGVNYILMQAFLNRDADKMEENIATLLKPRFHRHFNHVLATEKFISHPAAGWAKLAWLKGMQIEINHPLVPKELLPVQPLAEYPEYEFMMNDPEGRLE